MSGKQLFTVSYSIDYGGDIGAIDESLVLITNGDGQQAVDKAKKVAMKQQWDITDDNGNETGEKAKAMRFRLKGLVAGDWIDG